MEGRPSISLNSSQVERWQFSAKYELGSQVGIWHIDEEKREIMSGSNVVHVVSQKPTLIVTCSTRNNPTLKKTLTKRQARHNCMKCYRFPQVHSNRVVVDFFLTAVRMIACSLGQGVCPRVEVGSCRSVRSCVLTCVPN